MNKSLRLFGVFLLATGLFLTGCKTAAMVKAADEQAASGQWDEAVFAYASAVKKDPKNLHYRMKYARARSEAARIHYRRGMEYLEEGNHDAAQLEFSASLLMDPTYRVADEAYRKTQRQIDSIYRYGKGLDYLRDGKELEARREFEKALRLNPDNGSASAELEKLKTAPALRMDGYELNLKSTRPITLEFKNAGIKTIFGVLSKLSGVNFIFDSAVKDANTSIYLKDSTFKQALEMLLVTNNLSKKVASENTIIIYPDTPDKARQYDLMMVKVFYLTNIDAKKAVNLLRTMLKVKDVYVHEELNAVVVRDKPAAIELARKIFEATDLADAEVVLDVDIMEVKRNKTLDIGVNLPGAFNLTAPNTGSIVTDTTTYGIFLKDLDKLSSGDFLVTIPQGVLNLDATDSDTKILANPRIRVKNKEKAKIHIGERVPVITGTVSGTDIVTENVQYQDVGVKLNVEPTIRPNGEVDLKISLEVSSIVAEVTTVNSKVPQIGTRNFETTLRLYDGETQIMGGLISDEERLSLAKVPGLGDIPLFGRLFASTGKESIDTEILLSITPHIVKRLEVPDDDVTEIWPESAGDMGGDDSPAAGEAAPDMVDMLEATPEAAPDAAVPGEDVTTGQEGEALPIPPPPLPPGMPTAPSP